MPASVAVLPPTPAPINWGADVSQKPVGYAFRLTVVPQNTSAADAELTAARLGITPPTTGEAAQYSAMEFLQSIQI